ncbi:MAG: VanZ family protein [Candidatus Limnocylindrales bacterium]
MTSARLLLLAYLGVLALLVFLPFGRGMDLGDRLNLDPFATIERALQLGPRSSSFRLMLGNIAAFVPLGILFPLAFRSAAGLVSTFLVALALSVAIELGQLGGSLALGYAYRSTDVDDIILNVTGGMIGFAVMGLVMVTSGLVGGNKNAGHAK